MKSCKDNQFHLSICDPPYGIGADLKNSTDKKQMSKSSIESKDYGSQQWDSSIPTIEYFVEIERVSKRRIIWGANYYGLTGGMLFWDKAVTMPTYSKGELAYLSFKNSIDYFRFPWHGMIQGNMKNKESRIHPTQKPIALYKWLLQNYAKPGQTIFDSHVGSGSIRIACHDLGYDFTGCEIDADYHAAQEKRFQTHIAQAQLFDPAELTKETYRQEEL